MISSSDVRKYTLLSLEIVIECRGIRNIVTRVVIFEQTRFASDGLVLEYEYHILAGKL